MAVTAADVCANFELSPEAQALLKPTLPPRAFLDLLLANQHYRDAAHLMAHAMPRREAIWWACLCARATYGAAPSAKEAAALQLAETWVSKPTDENRRAAYKAAETAEFKNPAGLIGMAVFFGSGSLAPPGQGEVSPPPQLCGNSVANAVILAAVKEPAKTFERYLKFFALGFDVANGKNRWK